MRILFTTMPLSGHFNPLVPVARAVTAAGHEVAFACAPAFAPTIEREGFTVFPAGIDLFGQESGVLFAGRAAVPPQDSAFWTLARVFIEVFATVMTPHLLALCRKWPPDLIVRECSEYAGCVAAEVLGIPHASVRTVAISAAYTLRHRVTASLAVLRERHGLSPDPDAAMLFRYLHLAGEPPGFLLAGDLLAPTTHLLRPLNFEPLGAGLPAWVADLPDRPTIYATLGTVDSAATGGRSVFSTVLDALRDESINLILTVGYGNDPAQFEPQPENVHIECYIPQHLLLPFCDLVVNHGGFSTITGTLNAGLPMVVVPISADQPYNAECCATLGVGKVIAPEERTAAAIRDAMHEVLTDPTYRANAEGLRNAMAVLPGPEYAVELLEQLAVEKRPLLTARSEVTASVSIG